MYARDRTEILQKAMQIEHSPYVTDQLQVLEAHVLNAKKQYNSLKSQRKDKTRLLRKMLDALSTKDSQREDKTIMSARITELERGVSSAEANIESEEAVTKTLQHMKTARRDWISNYSAPVQRMKRELYHTSVLLTEAMQDTYRNQAEAQITAESLGSIKKFNKEKRELWTQSLERKAGEYRDKREFVELYNRNKAQRELFIKIKENEADLRAMDKHFRNRTEMEAALRSIRDREAKGKAQELLLEKLGQAASAYQITDIENYWVYLQTTKRALENSTQELHTRIDALKEELDMMKVELEEVKWRPGSKGKAGIQVNDLLARIEASNEGLDGRIEQVLSIQLIVWKAYIARVQDTLSHIASSLSPENTILTSNETMELIMTQALALTSS